MLEMQLQTHRTTYHLFESHLGALTLKHLI